MLKEHAIHELGGTVAHVASAIGISASAIAQWPEVLPPRIADRVIAALVRKGKHVPELWLQSAEQSAAMPATDRERHARSLRQCVETLTTLAAQHPESRAAYLEHAWALAEKAAHLTAAQNQQEPQ
nr:hypothetical protein [uncultured Ottowia sp.]